MPYVDVRVSEAMPAIAEGLYLIARLLSHMQTGTTSGRRIEQGPLSDRSAPPTGTCQRAHESAVEGVAATATEVGA